MDRTPVPLSGAEIAEQRRSVIQLMLAAREYITLAEACCRPTFTATHREMRDWFAEGSTPTSEQYEALYASAHVASAAVRLCTADEVIQKKLGKVRDSYNKASHYLKEHTPTKVDLGTKRLTWMHVMLRYGIGHYETIEADTQKDERWKERNDYLYQLTIGEMIEGVKNVEREIVQHLATLGLTVPFRKASG